MTAERPAPTEIVREPDRGRVFGMRIRPGIADAAPGGRVRLDAIARWLQDVAYLDLVDAGYEQMGTWIVRRTRIRAARLPHFGEDLEIRTFCSGIGRFCAERRTVIEGDEALVQAVATWVCLDPKRSAPMRFEDDFTGLYAESACGRGASVRLRHPGPPPGAAAEPWSFRATDLDLAAHVNNSRYWEVVESDLLAGGEPGAPDVEVEHAGAAVAGEALILRSDGGIWIADGERRVLASFLLRSAA